MPASLGSGEWAMGNGRDDICCTPHSNVLNTSLTRVTFYQYLNIWFNYCFTSHTHITYLLEYTTSRTSILWVINGLRWGENFQVNRTFYIHAIYSLLEYSALCFISHTKETGGHKKQNIESFSMPLTDRS